MIALHAWHLACRPGHARFRAALAAPQAAQEVRCRQLGLTATSLRRLPLTTWSDYQAWTEHLRDHGDDGSGTTHLIPTSGTGAARKLVPWTAGLAQEFRAAINPWIGELFNRQPALRDGPAYWAITPPPDDRPMVQTPTALPIGFADDSAYLGGRLRRLVAPTLAVDQQLIQRAGPTGFMTATLLALLRADGLRLISAWHPSLVLLLLDQLRQRRAELLDALPRGARRQTLSATAWDEAGQLWPELRLVSCWGDGPAESAYRTLVARLPGVTVQPKGLLATEGVVTIPFAGTWPLAVTSHVYEFLGSDGVVRWPHELREGDVGEVLLTTGGGLRRYRLGDRVQVTGWLSRTPCLRFLGRSGTTVDLVGEKLDEVLIAMALTAAGPLAEFAALQVRDDLPGYRLVVDGGCRDAVEAAQRVEAHLCRIHHYDLARRLGQLPPLLAWQSTLSAGSCLELLARERGQRLGEVKPPVLLSPALCFPLSFPLSKVISP